MKCGAAFVALQVLQVAVLGAARSIDIAEHVATKKMIPGSVARMVVLLNELEFQIKAEGKSDQELYDKYACWCEDTMGRKTRDIADAQASIEDLNREIKRLAAEVATHRAQIADTEKLLKENKESVAAATELREKEKAAFSEEQKESINALGALNAALTVLDGAGTGTKKTFLEAVQRAQVRSFIPGVKAVLKSALANSALSEEQLTMVSQFLSKPDNFLHPSDAASALQTGRNNPFGDYAPRSTVIQGILKQLKDDYTQSMSEAAQEEAAKVAEYKELMETKTTEAATLTITLQTHRASAATKTAKVAELKATRDDTKEQLAADQAFLESTTSACKATALSWGERSRLRFEELTGIRQAVAILQDLAAKGTNATNVSFLQLDSEGSDPQLKAYSRLQKLSSKYKQMALARLAVEVKQATGGNFDKVIALIDSMMATLRKEEASDIVHRDLCQMKQNANGNEMQDLDHDIKTTEDEIARTTNTIGSLNLQIGALETEITQSKEDLATLLADRNEQEKDFKKAVAEQMEAVSMLQAAVVSLTKFYKNNKLSLTLLQAPNYTVSPDTAPKIWEGDYTGKSSEGGGIIAIIQMIKEDCEKEIKTLKEEDAADQAAYLKMRTELQGTLNAQEALKVTKEEAVAKLNEKNQADGEFKDGKDAELKEEDAIKAALEKDCDWVAKNFASRYAKRKMEMEGLTEAKAYLAGAKYKPVA